jgi:hypothetical protein
MTPHQRDPAHMSPDERCAEIGSILAAGWRRLILSDRSREKDDLAVARRLEPHCATAGEAAEEAS